MTSPGAQEGGADRLWLATEAGMSPDLQVVSSVLKETDLPVRVMLRLNDSHTTTGGEFTRLGGLAEEYLSLGAEGVAFGFLDPDLEVDVDTCAALAERLTGVPWTFPAHRRRLPGAGPRVATAAHAARPRRGLLGRLAARPRRGVRRPAGAWPRPTREVADRLMPGQRPARRAGAVAGPGRRPPVPRRRRRSDPGGSSKAYVDAALVRSWRLLLGG